MLERNIYKDIQGGKNSFHSAVLTSFSFNFHHFENQVLRILKQKWINSINILVDQRMLDEVLGLSSGHLKTISQTYSVSGIYSKGAFHPKINFIIGDNKLLVIFGSGNITAGGHGKNHEIFTGFYADSIEHPQLVLILETWHYLQSITKHFEGYSSERINIVLPKACSLFQKFDSQKHQFRKIDETLEIALVYNDESSIFEQLTSLIDTEDITKITVVCPYYDENGSTLIHLINNYPNAVLDVFLQDDFGLPPTNILKNERINFYNWDNTDRGKTKIWGKNNYQRKLHSKIFIFENLETKYCLIGSANATKQGIGSLIEKPINDEFGALYKSQNMNFLNELGIAGTKIDVDIQTLKRSENISGDLPRNNSKKNYRIKYIDLNATMLKVVFEKPLETTDLELVTYNLEGDECFIFSINNSKTNEYRLSENQLKLNPRYCVIRNNKEFVSNKQLINFLDKLEFTNPSDSNRRIRHIISGIEGHLLNEFDIIDFMNELNDGKRNRTSRNSSGSSNKVENENNSDDDVSELTYEEAILALKKSPNPNKIINSNFTSLFLYSFSHLFEMTSNSIDDELMDEEEEGEASSSRKRRVDKTPEDKPTLVKSKNKGDEMLRGVQQMANNYIKSIKYFRSKSDHELDILDYHHLLLVSHLLSKVCYFTNYDLPKDINFIEWQGKLDKLFREVMLEVLFQFSILCHQKKKKSYPIENIELETKRIDALRKVVYNTILHLHLIERKSGEQVVDDKIILIGLTILHYCGIPDEFFDEYIINMSKNSQDLCFNPNFVFQLKEKLLSLYYNPELFFVFIPANGFCKIIESGSNIRFNSLYGINTITQKKMKELKRLNTPAAALM